MKERLIEFLIEILSQTIVPGACLYISGKYVSTAIIKKINYSLHNSFP